MISAEEINKMIPLPPMVKLPSATLGKPWWKQLWLYCVEPTEFVLVGNWKITLPNGMQIMVPDGFVFDGASIPWYLRWLISSFGPLLRGAIVHDFGYRHDFLLDWNGEKFAIKRGQEFYDDLFRDIVIWTTGLVPLARTAWAGVRVFGHKAWSKYRKREFLQEVLP